MNVISNIKQQRYYRIYDIGKSATNTSNRYIWLHFWGYYANDNVFVFFA